MCIRDRGKDTGPAQVIEKIETCANVLNRTACNFAAIDSEGNTVNLSDLADKPIILDFSAGWCGPCNVAAKEVEEIQSAYPGITYLTVLIEDYEGNIPDADDILKWQSMHNIEDAPVWGASREILTPEPLETAGKFYLSGWPTFYFLDIGLEIVGAQRGFDSDAIKTWAQDLDSN